MVSREKVMVTVPGAETLVGRSCLLGSGVIFWAASVPSNLSPCISTSHCPCFQGPPGGAPISNLGHIAGQSEDVHGSFMGHSPACQGGGFQEVPQGTVST